MIMPDLLNNNQYQFFLKDVRERIYKAQYDALKVVNKELIALYWDLGKSCSRKFSK